MTTLKKKKTQINNLNLYFEDVEKEEKLVEGRK